jgi:3-oxoacyl-[acyl-carrier protein] reductase
MPREGGASSSRISIGKIVGTGVYWIVRLSAQSRTRRTMTDQGTEMTTKELTGKVAVVTGAGRNIGRAIALTLAEGGASILVNARSNRAEADAVAGEIEAAGGKALVHIGDVADAKSVQAMTEAAVKQFGRIDILVNNAALRREKPFADMSYAEWREIMDVTLDGTFHCVKACLPALRQSGGGTIVNIGGLSAHTGAKNRAHVVTAKAGIIGFTRALAHDLADDGITVNCVVPGLIGTPRPKDRPEPAHHLTHGTITGERGRPEDVAAAVRFLCGPGARYVNGQAIHTNGGAYLGA